MSKTSPFDQEALRGFLQQHKIARLQELKESLRTTSTMTVFRKLKALGYRTSYSHRGQYYTLAEIAEFDDQGLWSCRSVWFCTDGNLLHTAKRFASESEAGFTAAELEHRLHVSTKEALLKLVRDRELYREKVSGVWAYVAADRQRRRHQLLMRKKRQAEWGVVMGASAPVSCDEMKAALLLFYSLLNEQQRRLYAGLEATRLGHGGDRQMADLFDLDPHTVLRGRRELFAGHVQTTGVRRKGGGRKPVEKKRRRSSGKSKHSCSTKPQAIP